MKGTKHVRWDFHSVAWAMPRVGTLALGRPGGQKLFYFTHGQLAYQIDGDDKQNRMKVNFLPYCQTGELGVRSKGQI